MRLLRSGMPNLQTIHAYLILYYTGKAVNAEDPNGTVYSGYYDDGLDRPTQMVSAAADTTLKSQTKCDNDSVTI